MNALDAMVGVVTAKQARRRVVRIASLPQAAIRCEPTAAECDQEALCARANDWSDDDAPTVDASVCLSAGWCPMFIDKRGLALLEVA